MLLQLLQADHWPSQLIGHGCVLQLAVSVVDALQVLVLPPWAAGCVTVYVLVRLPPSHCAVHALHSLQNPLQSSGHGCVLQPSDDTAPSAASHVSALPPCAAYTSTLYTRSRVPPPQVAEQLPQLDHEPAQSTGHGSVLHAPDSDAPSDAAHVAVLPPSAAGVTT